MLLLFRYYSSSDDSLALLFLDYKFFAYTVEDEFRSVKIMGETRIPAGIYTLVYRHSPSKGRKMIYIEGIPTHKDVMFHSGNTEADTAGCILPGHVASFNPSGNSRVLESRVAMTRLDDAVIPRLEAGEEIKLVVIDGDQNDFIKRMSEMAA